MANVSPFVFGLASWSGLAGLAEAGDCRLALSLALDVSGSVDAAEYRLMHDGLAQALLAPDVVEAFLSGDPVALHIFEWADQYTQKSLLPGWHIIESEDDLVRVASVVAQFSGSPTPIPPSTPTALGAALAHAGQAFAKNPGCRAQTVDVSGDGWNNDGLEPASIYRRPSFDAVTVNALVIDAGPEDADRLVEWFQSEVLHGPAAFHVLAEGYEDFERAMEAKLQRELELPQLSGWQADGSAG